MFLRRIHATENDSSSTALNNNACSVCGDRFTSVCDLLNHRNSAHDMPTCLLCHKLVFTSQRKFSAHWKTHNVHGGAVASAVTYGDLVSASVVESDGARLFCRLGK